MILMHASADMNKKIIQGLILSFVHALGLNIMFNPIMGRER